MSSSFFTAWPYFLLAHIKKSYRCDVLWISFELYNKVCMLGPSPKKPCIMKHVYLHFDTESIRHVKRALVVVLAWFAFSFYWPLWKFTLLLPYSQRPQPPPLYLGCLEQSHQTFTHFCAFQFSTPSKQTLFRPFPRKLFLCIVRLHCVFVDSKVDQGKSVIA